MEPKYPALSTIAAVYRILGWFVVSLTIVIIIIGLIQVFVNQEFIGSGLLGFIGALLGATLGSIVVLFIYGAIGAFFAIMNFAVAEVLELFMGIEENTRSA